MADERGTATLERTNGHSRHDPESILRRASRVEQEMDIVPQRTQQDRMDSLVECTTELIAALRDQNTSWSIERGGFIHDVKEMHSDFKEMRQEVAKIPLMEQTLTGIQKFIDGDGKEIHVGQRLHEFKLTTEQHAKDIAKLEKEINGLKNEKRRLHRWIYSLAGSLFVGAALIGLKYLGEHFK
jgi:hypothetical protein